MRKGNQAIADISGTVLIVGARKFVFSTQVQATNRVTWWGPAEEKGDTLPDNLVLAFAKRGLARVASVKAIALSKGAELVEFSDEVELFANLNRILGVESDRSKEAVAPANIIPGNGHTMVRPSQDLLLHSDQLIDVPVNRVRRFVDQPRKFFNEERLRSLGRSMIREGQQIPIIIIPVTDDPDHDYQLYDGERRWRAAKIIGKVMLRAIVAKSTSDAELHKKSAICNFGREDHQALEVAWALKKIKAEEKLSINELADSFSRSAQWVVQHLSLLKLNEQVQKLMDPELPDEERITFSVALEIIKVPSEHQLLEAKYILEHRLNLPRVRHHIRKRIAEIGASSIRRRRKPNDDYRIFKTFLRHSAMRIDQFLDLPGGVPVGSLFRNRSWLVASEAANAIAVMIEKLQKIKNSIESEVSKK